MTKDEGKKIVEEHRKAGDLIQFVLQTRASSYEEWSVIRAFISEKEFEEYSVERKKYVASVVEDHTAKGDFIPWMKELLTKDIGMFAGLVYQSNHCTSSDFAQYISLMMDQAEAGKVSLAWSELQYITKEKLKECVIPAYKERIEKHRNAGDLRNYFFGVFLRDEIEASNFIDNERHSINESVVYIRENVERFLTPAEIKEFKTLAKIAYYLRVHECVRWDEGGVSMRIRKYLCKLSKTPKNSKDYELYMEIRERTKSSEKTEFDKQIKKQKMLNILVPAVAAAVLILFGVFFVITM